MPIVLGDARLTMAAEPAGFYDVIIVDAYSSDAIPVHLATREAMALYKSRLAPHGVVVMHISNRHLELESVVTGIAAANGMKTWLWNDPKFGANVLELISPSHVAVAAEKAEDVGTIATSERWTLTAPDPVSACGPTTIRTSQARSGASSCSAGRSAGPNRHFAEAQPDRSISS